MKSKNTSQSATSSTLGSMCAFCHETIFQQQCTNMDLQTGEIFPIVSCSSCGQLRTICPFTGSDLKNYYGPKYYGIEGRRFPKWMEGLISRNRDARARLVKKFSKGPARLLDIGCGRGLMLRRLSNEGWDSHGTEASQSLVDTLSQHHNLSAKCATTLSECNFDSVSFDCITLWHVFEHLVDPAETLREIDRIMKPGGIGIIEVPNSDSLQARLGGGTWFHFDAPRHLYHFSLQRLTDLIQGGSNVILETSTVSWEQGPYGMIQTLLNRLSKVPNILYGFLKHPSMAF